MTVDLVVTVRYRVAWTFQMVTDVHLWGSMGTHSETAMSSLVLFGPGQRMDDLGKFSYRISISFRSTYLQQKYQLGVASLVPASGSRDRLLLCVA